jgi:hypothetical protein
MNGGCEKNARDAFFVLASHPRFAYKDFTEALMPGNEEIAR